MPLLCPVFFQALDVHKASQTPHCKQLFQPSRSGHWGFVHTEPRTEEGATQMVTPWIHPAESTVCTRPGVSRVDKHQRAVDDEERWLKHMGQAEWSLWSREVGQWIFYTPFSLFLFISLCYKNKFTNSSKAIKTKFDIALMNKIILY